jgi:hypothetical protein
VPLPAAWQAASVVHVVLDPPVVGGQRGSSCGLTPLVAVVKIRRRILRSVDSPTVASVAEPMSEEKLYSPVTGTMQFVFPAAHAAPAGVLVMRSKSFWPASQSWHVPGTGSVAPAGQVGFVLLLMKAVRWPLNPGRSNVGWTSTGAVVLNRVLGSRGSNLVGSTHFAYSNTLSTTPGDAAKVPVEAARAIAWLSASTSCAVLLARKASRQLAPAGQVAAVWGVVAAVLITAPDPPCAITLALAGAMPTPKATTKVVAWCWGSVGSAFQFVGTTPGFVL